ncbi:MAG: hypothetical protein GY875_24125 [Gammaproteobacteria bacterium]|nr:hypothetical protein [Gammaproteobacteria bacterium]
MLIELEGSAHLIGDTISFNTNTPASPTGCSVTSNGSIGAVLISGGGIPITIDTSTSCLVVAGGGLAEAVVQESFSVQTDSEDSEDSETPQEENVSESQAGSTSLPDLLFLIVLLFFTLIARRHVTNTYSRIKFPL